MPPKTPESGSTRRGFLLFILVAPAALLILVAIILLAQYRELQKVVSPYEAVPAFVWDSVSMARKNALLSAFNAFSEGAQTGAADTLFLSASDLTLLAAASPVARAQNLHMRVSSRDSLLVIETTQSIEDQNRRFSWVFKKLIPHEYRYLNARLEGVPELKSGLLTLFPERGYLNEGKVSRTALSKRGELSPRAYLDSAALPAYERVLDAMDTLMLTRGGVMLIPRSCFGGKGVSSYGGSPGSGCP